VNPRHLGDSPDGPGKPAWTLHWGRWATGLLVVLLLLLGVFSLYLQPDFLLTLADQLWACF